MEKIWQSGFLYMEPYVRPTSLLAQAQQTQPFLLSYTCLESLKTKKSHLVQVF